MNATDQDIINNLREYILLAQDEEGMDAEVSPETLEKLHMLVRKAPAVSAPVQAELDRPTPHANEEAVNAPALPEPARQVAMQTIADHAAQCTCCDLHKSRNNAVPGQGNLMPELMFVGEGPGEEEDRQGLAFVGRAGELLTKMIKAMGYTRDSVFIANIVKCHPPKNRAPLPAEISACFPFVHEQIRILRPRVIIALGATAVTGLLGETEGITRIRGKWHKFEGIDVMPTFHPAFLLRNPMNKRPVWDDLKNVLQRLGHPIPKH